MVVLSFCICAWMKVYDCYLGELIVVYVISYSLFYLSLY